MCPSVHEGRDTALFVSFVPFAQLTWAVWLAGVRKFALPWGSWQLLHSSLMATDPPGATARTPRVWPFHISYGPAPVVSPPACLTCVPVFAPTTSGAKLRPSWQGRQSWVSFFRSRDSR